MSGSTEKVSGAPAIAAGIIGGIILQIIFSNSEFINNVFYTAPMRLYQWIMCLIAALPMIVVPASANRFDPPN